MLKVYIIGGNQAYTHLFNKLGFDETKDLTKAHLLCFTGGEDVSPEFYEHPKHPTTFNNKQRDLIEQEMFDYGLKKHLPMVGICRGGQFLNVMNGGTMYQNVTNHCREHHITTIDGRKILVSSTHHQMMCSTHEAIRLAFAEEDGVRTIWRGEDFITEPSYVDEEVLFYAKTRCLCFQPHPEFYSTAYEDMRNFFKDCLDKYLHAYEADGYNY